MSDSSPPVVRRRQVFYLSGFDPRGAAHYRRLYGEQAAARERAGGPALAIGPRRRDGDLASRWRIDSADGAATDYRFLHWDDLIRAHWLRGELQLIAAYLGVIWLGLRTGALVRVLRASGPPFVAVMFPLVLLLLLMAAGGAAGWLADTALLRWLGGGATADLMPPAALLTLRLAGLFAGLLAFAGVMQLGRLAERRLNCYWLLRIYAFSIRLARGRLPDVEERLDDFADLLVEHCQHDDADEVLIVAHSVGTILAPMLLARALAIDPDFALRGPRVSLLTLGQCIPMVSFLPQAKAIRADLAALAATPEIDWIDFTAPTDGACFALVDPLASSGIAQPDAAAPRPKLLSPRFARLFTPATYQRIRRDWYRIHFQYLMAGELAATEPGAYDFFAITAGPLRLADRFAMHAGVRGWQRGAGKAGAPANATAPEPAADANAAASPDRSAAHFAPTQRVDA